jgi:signal peptidase II
VSYSRPARAGVLAFAASAALTLGVAQLGSFLVQSRLPLHDTYVVNSVLHLTHIRNTGGVFGLLPGHGLVFVVTSSLIILGLVTYVVRQRITSPFQAVCFGLIVGAAASNVCDRLVYGSVVDFIDVQGIPGWRYIFNVADVAIHLGAWPLAIGALLSAPRKPPPPAEGAQGN